VIDGVVNIQCRIDEVSDRISGQLQGVRGKAISFEGWVEFAAAIVTVAKSDQARDQRDAESETASEVPHS